MELLQRRLITLSLLLAFVVVVLGAYTRLVDAGLGCPDWPTCYGHLWVPKTPAEVEAANLRFAHAPVEHDKTWPEQTHRIVAASLGLMFIAIVSVACYLRFKKNRSVPVAHPVAMLALIICQGLFGMWTVTLLLWPQVVVAHLLGGFATASLLFLLALRMRGVRWQFDNLLIVKRAAALKPYLYLLLAALVVQIFLGGWTAANYAAVACADFPKCHDQWWPQADFKQGFDVMQQVGPNYLGGQLDNHARTAIHLSHRLGALVFTALALLSIVKLWRVGAVQTQRAALVLMAALLGQLLLGVSNVVFALPLPVAVAHNACAAILLLVVIYIAFHVQGVAADYQRREIVSR